MHIGNKKFIILLLFFVFPTTINAQNIGLGSNCWFYNQALLAHSFIEMKGEKSICEMLDKNIRVTLYCKIDSFGHVCKIERMRYFNSSNPNNKDTISKTSLESYLKEKKIQFFICYAHDDGFSKEKSIELCKEDFRNGDGEYSLFLINFPGELMIGYDAEREKLIKQKMTLSKYDYLIRQIKYYLKE